MSDSDFFFENALLGQPTVVNVTVAGLKRLGYTADKAPKGIQEEQYCLAYHWSTDPSHQLIMRRPMCMMKPALLGQHQAGFGFWGNPFKLADPSDDDKRLQCVTNFYNYAKTNPEILRRLPELTGKELGCVCAPKLCHGHALVRLWRETQQNEGVNS
eukprot:PhM_4_TR3333/c0_g2_i1/m.84174